MKRFLQVCSVLLLSLLLFTPFAKAAGYSEIYVLITDAMINTNQDNEEQAKQAIEEIEKQWATVVSQQTAAKEQVDRAVQDVVQADEKQLRLTALAELSKALKALDSAENPVDEQAERDNFYAKFSPFMKQWEEAYATNDEAQILAAHKQLDAKWNKNEKPVRAQSIGLYGQIETQLAFMRIALANEQPDTSLANSHYESLKQLVEQFMAGEDVAVKNEGHSLQDLVDLIDKAIEATKQTDYKQAADALTEFIIIWPNVEIEVSTRDHALYTALESDIPILVSKLGQSQPDGDALVKQLKQYKIDIQLLQQDKNYTFWDSALILLREGLEAILIIMVLVTFLQRANQERMVKWIYTGAGAGILLSAGMAILLAVVFDSLTSGTNREMIEGWVGLAAAIMMIGVGIWLHTKSNVKSWNAYISKQMGRAISTGSIIAMVSISFLSVFREGAETILFYAGIIPKMEMSAFLLGIAVALVILVVVAFIFMKFTVKIPIHYFFMVATLFIYVLAFKIIGTSIHTLQLTDIVSSHVIPNVPVINVIGFYPTIETIVGQVIIIMVWLVVTVLEKRKVRVK